MPLRQFRFLAIELHSAPYRKIYHSDWFVNSFIMVLCENFFSSVRIWCPKDDKKYFSQTTIVKLFANQSELIDLPTACTGISCKTKHLSWKLAQSCSLLLLSIFTGSGLLAHYLCSFIKKFLWLVFVCTKSNFRPLWETIKSDDLCHRYLTFWS